LLGRRRSGVGNSWLVDSAPITHDRRHWLRPA
jgi:hypothetical protein